jgi:hypothetical protein
MQLPSDRPFVENAANRESETQQILDALLELRMYLEAYGPRWYSEELHNKLDHAVRHMETLVSEAGGSGPKNNSQPNHANCEAIDARRAAALGLGIPSVRLAEIQKYEE